MTHINGERSKVWHITNVEPNLIQEVRVSFMNNVRDTKLCADELTDRERIVLPANIGLHTAGGTDKQLYISETLPWCLLNKMPHVSSLNVEIYRVQ